MSWAGTYSHTMALALDRFGAALLFNRPDITISSMCWIVRERKTSEAAKRGYALSKLNWWQTKLLEGIGWCLESTFSGHCAAARKSDMAVANSVLALLGSGLAS